MTLEKTKVIVLRSSKTALLLEVMIFVPALDINRVVFSQISLIADTEGIVWWCVGSRAGSHLFWQQQNLNMFKYLLKALQNSAFAEEGWRKCVQTPSFTFRVANDSHVTSMLSTLMNNELHSLSCNWTNFTQISKISSQAWFPSVLIVADLGWMSDTHSATLSLYLSSRTGEKLIGWDKISNQFNLLMIKIDLDGGK